MKFKEKVYEKLKKVPFGKITTYKLLAKAVNSKAYRAVGNILNKNPYKDVPCFKVVRSNGEVGGYASGTKNKIKMLKKEGIKIKNNKIIKFKDLIYKF